MTTHPEPPTELRTPFIEEIESDLGHYRKDAVSLTATETRWLIESKWAGMYRNGECEISDISDHLDTFRYHSPTQFTKQRTAPIPPDWRSLAHAEIVANTAGRDKDVRDFRRELLGDKLLSPESIPEWIRSHAETDGPPTELLQAPVDDERNPLTADEALALGYGVTWSRVKLYYSSPGSDVTSPLFVRLLGVLDRLRILSKRLRDSYGWEQAAGVSFVLAGVTPPPFLGSVSVSTRLLTQQQRQLGWRVTVSVTANPDWVTASTVAEIYRNAVRDESLYPPAKNRTGEPGTGRPMQEKNARLAVFAAEHYEPDKGNWKQLMTRWNAEHPEWKHQDRRAFAGACRKAYERVTGLPLKERT